MKVYHFHQVDVFSDRRFRGNALAVIHGADDISSDQMQAIARWTNLSETTFLLEPTQAQADYRVRIFTSTRELPFAGHPTLGTCYAWASLRSAFPRDKIFVQECGVGLVQIRQSGDSLAFAAPPLLRTGPLEESIVQQIADGFGLSRKKILLHQWIDNGPGWCAVLLDSADSVLNAKANPTLLAGFKVGLIGPRQDGVADYEVRAFFDDTGIVEDPVTGSLNAGLAQWLIGTGIAKEKYTVSQGTVLFRQGRVLLEKIGSHIWVGGQVTSCIDGKIQF